jgi:hypothetical protein
VDDAERGLWRIKTVALVSTYSVPLVSLSLIRISRIPREGGPGLWGVVVGAGTLAYLVLASYGLFHWPSLDERASQRLTIARYELAAARAALQPPLAQ